MTWGRPTVLVESSSACTVGCVVSTLELFVFSAIAVGATRSIPQVLRILRSGSTKGISPVGFALTAAGALLWLGWAVAAGVLPLFLPGNLIAVSCAAAVLFVFARRGGRLTVALLAAFGYAVFGGLVFLFFGPLYLSLVAACSNVGFALFGLYAFLRSPDRSGVSPWSWSMVAYAESIWLCWGLVYSVPASIISAAISLPSSLVILALTMRASLRPKIKALHVVTETT